MSAPSNELGISITLLEKLSIEIIPEAEAIHQRLNNGEKLDHWDRQLVEELIINAEQLKPYVDRHPEYQDLYARVAHLYKNITDLALANEK